jgi:hypothetical protein
MKKALVLAAVLGVALAACKTMEPRPEPPQGGDCSAPGGSAPPAPSRQTIPETGTVPPVPQSTEIVVGYCPASGQYQAIGVNTQTRQFTFSWRGGRATQPAAFTRFYEARVPVTVYTSPVRLTAGAVAPAPMGSVGASALAPAPGTPPQPALGPAPVPAPPTDDGSENDGDFDPCETISEEPPTSPGPKGSHSDPQPTVFQSVAWRTAYAVDAVTDPVAPSTAPVPR